MLFRSDFTPFGISLITEIASNPWRFASKRFDQELNLVYFGNRYYDPQSSRWLTIDPAQFRDSSNLYQYVFNNPFKYTDPDRRYAIALPILAWGTRLALIPLTATLAAPIAATILTGAALYGGCKLIQYTNNLITETMLRDSYTNEITTNNYFKHYLSEEESDSENTKKHTQNQKVLSDFAKESAKTGASDEDADTLLGWAKEYDFPHRDDRGKPHWLEEGVEHIHIGKRHVPIRN